MICWTNVRQSLCGFALWCAFVPAFAATQTAAGNNASVVSQSVVPYMASNGSYVATVIMLNNGVTTWTAGADYRLGAQAPANNLNWLRTTSRVELPNSVGPGQSVTFTIPVIGPAVPGPYAFQWQMVRDGYEWFGDPTDPAPVQVSGNNAEFITQALPGPMTPGGQYSATVTMKNTGVTQWTPGAQYLLGSYNPRDNHTWGPSRVSLPNAVNPGQTVTFQIPITAPATAGWYNYQWQMIQEGAEWFGAPSQNQVLRSGINASQFVSQWAPATMGAGASTAVNVTMKNTGSTTWRAAEGYKLGSQNPQDNTGWIPSANRVALPNDVAPGQSVTFSFSVAPATVGARNFQWQMIQDGIAWFGDLSQNVAVQVGYNNALFDPPNVPTSMAAGYTYPVSLTVKNTGNTTWVPASGYRLGSQNPPNTWTWNVARVDLPSEVPPQASATLNFDVTAPTTPGNYNFQWQMLVEDVTWFGGLSTNKVVQVSAPAPPVATLGGVVNGQTLYEGTGVQLSGSGTSPLPVTKVEIFIDGALMPSLPSTGAATSYAWLRLPLGDHTLTARAWNSAGSASDTKIVHVTVDPIDVPFHAKVDSLKTALASGNRDAARALLSPEARRMYGPVFDALEDEMPSIVAKWSKPIRLSNSAGTADYLVQRSDNGKIYVISFILDDDGNWVIDSM